MAVRDMDLFKRDGLEYSGLLGRDISCASTLYVASAFRMGFQ